MKRRNHKGHEGRRIRSHPKEPGHEPLAASKLSNNKFVSVRVVCGFSSSSALTNKEKKPPRHTKEGGAVRA
jgi:hypothetical protein